jgi:hypothetical protein
MVRLLQRGSEVFGERNSEVFELLLEALVEVVFGLLGVVDGGLVAVMEEMTSSDETVSAIVAGATLKVTVQSQYMPVWKKGDTLSVRKYVL